MQEGNPLPLRPDPRRLVDEPESGRATLFQGAVKVVHGEAHVMNTGASLGDESGNRRVVGLGLEQFDEGFTGRQAGDGGTIGVVEGDLGHAEHIAVQWKQFVEGTHGDADVGNAGTAARRIGHGSRIVSGVAFNLILIMGAVSEQRWRCTLEHNMANALAVTDDSFATEIESHDGLAMVDFWATWCAPCRMIAPIVEQLAVDHAGKVKVAKLDVDSNQMTAMKFNVRSIPTILFFKNGKLVDQVVGAVPRPALEAKIEQHAG